MSEFAQIPEKKKMLFGGARTLVIALTLFAVIVVTTADIRLVTVRSLADLGLDFFILLFVSYGMYVCCADGGISAGYATDSYKKSVARFDTLKEKIEESMLTRMEEFCDHYADQELRRMRMHYLAVVCIPYEVYLEKYVTLGKREVKRIPGLKRGQKRAIIKANAIKRIRMTPERIMTLGKNVRSRAVLGVTPETMKNIAFGKRFVRMSIISAMMSIIAFDMVAEPTWVMFATVCLKLVAVVINGYDGHRTGFANITTHTVGYINAQSMLMSQAIQYIEAHPTTNE